MACEENERSFANLRHYSTIFFLSRLGDKHLLGENDLIVMSSLGVSRASL